jgi:hypothetical protein
MHKVAKITTMVIGGLVLVVIMAFLFGLLVKVLWNALMPDIFGLPEIGYWQAVGLVILSHLLVGGGHGIKHTRGRSGHREKRHHERPPEPDPVQA